MVKPPKHVLNRFYVKTYPKGEGAARVSERLAALASVPAAAPVARPARKEEDTGWQISGGFGQTRYYGIQARCWIHDRNRD